MRILSTTHGQVAMLAPDATTASHIALPIDDVRQLLWLAEKFPEIASRFPVIDSLSKILREDTGLESKEMAHP